MARANRWLVPALALLGALLIVAAVVAVVTPDTEAPEVRAPEAAETDAPVSQAADTAEENAATDAELKPGPQSTAAPAESTQLSATDSYRVAVIELNDQIGEQLGQLTDQLVVPRYDDAAWVAGVRATLSAMELTADRARAIEPAAEYEAAHAVWMEGIDSYDWAAENMAKAIGGPDYELMNQCNDRLFSASESFRQAMELMKAVESP